MSKKMYESLCLGASTSMHIYVSMSRKLSIGMSKNKCK